MTTVQPYKWLYALCIIRKARKRMKAHHKYLSFVGLGQMGQPMARNLLQATKGEIDLCVFDQQTERMTPLVEQGAIGAARLGAVAQAGGIVFSMVPDDRILLQIALGEGGILKQITPGGIHVSCSTVSPSVSEQLAKLYQKQGCTYLAATVLGRPDVAEQGALSIVLAGPHAAKQRVKPFLACMGKRLYDLGEKVQVANVAKIACNFLIAASIEAMGEAAALADAYDLDRSRFFQIIRESPLFSGTIFKGYGTMIAERDFSDNRFPVPYGLKDVELAIQVAQQCDLDLPYADVAFEHLLAAQDAGRGHEDWAVLSDFARLGTSIGLFDTERF